MTSYEKAQLAISSLKGAIYEVLEQAPESGLKNVEIGKKLGFTAAKSAEAFEKALSVQAAYREEKKKLGREVIEELHKHPLYFPGMPPFQHRE